MSEEQVSIAPDIDYIFENVVGGNNFWQWYILFLLWPILTASVFPWLLHLFTSYEPKHRCFVPNCDDLTSIFESDFTQFALPQSYKSAEMLQKDQAFDPCQQFNSSFDSCKAEFFSNQTVKCNSFVYDNSIFEETLTSKLDLVCENDYKRRFLSTIMVLGLVIGSYPGNL